MSAPPKACRSPYCECEHGKCTHPGCVDARHEPWPPSTEEMNVRSVLSTNFPDVIRARNGLYTLGGEAYISWMPKSEKITLDGSFTAMEIAAIAWWMMNKGGQHDDAVPT